MKLNNIVNNKLINYIEENVFPLYDLNEKGHGIDHINYVIRRSIEFAKEAAKTNDINYDMVYVIAAYHDVGHHIDAKNHEKVSANIMFNDPNLRDFFDDEEIFIMKEAIEEHRSSLEGDPTTIYGKIVVTADHNISYEKPFLRTYSYRVKNFPNSTLDEIIEDSRQHLISKYGKDNGYANSKHYFNDEEFYKHIEELNKILNDEDLFRKTFIEINKIERGKELCLKNQK